MKMKYQQAYDKIIQAYYKDEIQPMRCKFCFCGTLNDNNGNWGTYDNLNLDKKNYYTRREYTRMEDALFNGITGNKIGFFCFFVSQAMQLPDAEDRLFRGMSKALDELKKIHIKRGENVEYVPKQQFIKRKLLKHETANV